MLLVQLTPSDFLYFSIKNSLKSMANVSMLSQKTKLKLLAKMVIISFNPTTHPNKYEGGKIDLNLERKSCLSIWVDPKNVFGPWPNLKYSQIGAKNFWQTLSPSRTKGFL